MRCASPPRPYEVTSRTDTRRLLEVTRGLLLAAALAVSGCDDSSTATSPTDTSSTTTTTVASPTATELFAGRVTVGGSTFYSFTVVENGTVNVTAVKGGLEVPAESGSDSIIIANAAVIVSFDDGKTG